MTPRPMVVTDLRLNRCKRQQLHIEVRCSRCQRTVTVSTNCREYELAATLVLLVRQLNTTGWRAEAERNQPLCPEHGLLNGVEKPRTNATNGRQLNLASTEAWPA